MRAKGDFCEVERANADQIDDTHAIVARWREFINRCDGKVPNFPVDLGLDPSGNSAVIGVVAVLRCCTATSTGTGGASRLQARGIVSVQPHRAAWLT